MKLTSPNNINFGNFYNNKLVLKTLEKISDHPASFSAAASMAGALVLRPLAITVTPLVDKEKKKYLSANSLSSAIGKFLIAEAFVLPIEKAVKKIDKTKIDNFNIKSQIIKQGTGVISAIPKSLLTVSLIPIIVDKMLTKKRKNTGFFLKDEEKKRYNKVISFTGKLDNTVNSIIQSKKLDNFINKKNIKEKDLARNASVLTDTLLVTASSIFVKKSKKIKEDKKRTLIYNNIISTLICILSGCAIDKAIKDNTKNFIDNFKKMHKNDPKLEKYIEGINVLRPALIFAAVYYGILPVFSGFLADKIDSGQKK